MIDSLQGKTALVTGGGQRIGRAVSLALAREGANIVVHYPYESREAEGLLKELDKLGVKHWSLKADFTEPAEYETLIKRAMEACGPLDILINNASIFTGDTMESADFSNLSKNIEINAWAPFVLIREFAASNKGSVVNILDTRVKGFDWAHTSYILSKRVLLALTEMSALKFSPGVRVNAVAPGLILPPAGKDEAYLQALAPMVPLQKHGGPEDVAAAAVYLIKNDFITGQVLFVDGGRHLKAKGNGQYNNKRP